MLPANSGKPMVYQPVMLSRFRFVALLQRLMQQTQVDRAVILGVLSKIWGLGSGPVTVLLIASHFTPELQGYYYTFGSLLALTVFVELGLGQVILQFASHEWSRLTLDKHGGIVGEPQALSRLVSLGRFAFCWYAVAGGLVAVGLGLAGFVFFSHSSQIGMRWMAPWFVLCFLTGVNLSVMPFWSLLEGCNQITQVYAYRLVQGILSSISIWSAILFGAGLWTASVASMAGLVCGALFLYRRHGKFFYQFFVPIIGDSISWRAELWPLQWRIAVSWLSGYFCFSLFTPVVFQFDGPIAAGQMGMTWTLVSSLSSISATWINVKTPRFGILVASKDYFELDRLVLRSGFAAVGVASCGAVAIEGLIWLLYAMHHPLATRVLPPFPTGLFLLATVLMQISYPQSVYLRAHKREPFLGLSVVSSLLIGLLTVLMGSSRYGAAGIAVGYLAVVASVVVPIGSVIWYRCRAAWHTPISGQ